jgi:ribosomal protein S18 acetylase RimI-like enzyme
MTNRFVGHLDTVEPALAGWVIDRRHPSEPVCFTLIIDGAWHFTVVADRERPDVSAAGFGGPNCGFELILPAHLLNGAAHDFELMLGDGQPQTLTAWYSPIVLGPLAADIAPITSADLDDAVDLLRQTHVESGLEPEAISIGYVTRWIGTAGGAAGGLLIGARVGKRLVGYAMLERGPGAAAAVGVIALSVLRHYRRRGLGERLMRALLAGVRDGGKIDEVWLSVAPGNLPARRLYEKLGFVDRANPPPSLFVPASYVTMLWQPEGPDR